MLRVLSSMTLNDFKIIRGEQGEQILELHLHRERKLSGKIKHPAEQNCAGEGE